MAIIASTFGKVDDFVNSFVVGGYQALAAELTKPVWLCFTLYVMVIGFAYLRQSYHFTITDMAIRIMRGAIILTLALNWGTFSAWAYEGLFATLTHLGDSLITSITGAAPTDGNAVEAGFLSVMTGFSAMMSSAIGFKVPDISMILSALCVLFGGIILYSFAIFVMLFSKVAFAITVVLAPLFIPFSMFEATKDVFGAWARTVLGFVVIPVLATCVLAFQLSLMSDLITQAGTGNMNPMDAAIFALLCTAFFLILKEVPGIGASMVGAVGVTGAGAMAKLFMDPITRAVDQKSRQTVKNVASRVYGSGKVVATRATGRAVEKARSAYVQMRRR